MPNDRDEVYRYVRGAIVSCIKTHGPITNLLIDSATKRIVGELMSVGLLKNYGRLRRSYTDEKCDNCGGIIPALKLYRRTQSFKVCFTCLPPEEPPNEIPEEIMIEDSIRRCGDCDAPISECECN